MDITTWTNISTGTSSASHIDLLEAEVAPIIMGTEFLTLTAAHHQGASQTFWLYFWEVLTLFIFLSVNSSLTCSCLAFVTQVLIAFCLSALPLLTMTAVFVVPDYFTPAMLGLKMDQEVLGELVKVKVPRVWQTMMDNNVTWTLVVSRWFICLYIDVLPVEVSVSVCPGAASREIRPLWLQFIYMTL